MERVTQSAIGIFIYRSIIPHLSTDTSRLSFRKQNRCRFVVCGVMGVAIAFKLKWGSKSMSATIINIIIQLIAGAVGGNAAGAGLKNYDLGTLGNTIAGALGGVGGGQILTALLPMLAGTADNVDIGAIIGQAVGGGVAGAIVTFVVGLIKNTMAGQPAR
jgi:hypothetical protein